MARFLALFCLCLAGMTLAAQESAGYVSPNVGVMVFVPAGSFQRSSANTNISAVSAFYIGKHEVTRTQYAAVGGKPDPSDPIFAMTFSDPVQMVSWYDALVFCNRLSVAEGLQPVYSIGGTTEVDAWGLVPGINNLQWNAVSADWTADGYRLPTEMEWRWAAMGADRDSIGLVNYTGYLKPYSGSSGPGNLGDYAWMQENSNRRTNPVGMKKPNELGIHDMSGNVWEWCWDWYDRYPSGFFQDYHGPSSGEYKVLGGGCWSMPPVNCAVSNRYFYDPHYRLVNYGFRVVRRF